MITPHHNSLCGEAKLYYYDFLCDESRELIPESIINHIEQCQHCQEQIDQLKVVLSQTDGIEPEQGQVSSAITTILELHFAYIGKRVTCKTVRPFLPGLLDPALEIRIPTPITVHLDNCQKCTEDLETIRSLNLNRKQLCHLSQFLAEKPNSDGVSCSQARGAILSVALMAFRETSAAVLKHLCTCPNCRKALYQYRESVRMDLLLYKKAPKEFPCEKASATDIFDYCLPYGIDPATDQYAKFRESLTSHLLRCPDCLAKIQELHNILYGIAERLESEVVTIYHMDESAKAQAVSEPDDLYAGFPISVEIVGREDKADVEQPAPTIDFTNALKQKVSAMNLKPLLKTGVAVAAVILIGLALLLNTPTAKAVTIDQIYKAIEKVKNVYISTFVPDKPGPTQEKWVSRKLNIYMTKTGKELVLWDVINETNKTKFLDTDAVETILLSAKVTDEIEKTMIGSLGLSRFADLYVIPENVSWSHVIEKDMVTGSSSAEIYDLRWTQGDCSDPTVFNKCRFYVDAKTYLPQRIEYYKKLSDDGEYTMYLIWVIEYLTESEIQAAIKDAFF